MSVQVWTSGHLVTIWGTMNEITFVDEYSALIAVSVTASDLCRKLVHSPITGAGAVGAQILVIDQQAQINQVGSYGKGIQVGELSVWDEHPLSESVRSQDQVAKELAAIDGSTLMVYSLPLLKAQEPVGILALNILPGSEVNELSSTARSAISKITAIWLESLGLGSMNGNSGTGPIATTPSPESLTERQLTVLRGMAEGKTNAQIAAEMILSESTIRQETVRIYRALGVSSRNDAAKKALHLGILQRIAI